jgi:hypothetical protein
MVMILLMADVPIRDAVMRHILGDAPEAGIAVPGSPAPVLSIHCGTASEMGR